MAIVFGGLTADMFFFSGLMLLGFAMSEMFEKRLPLEMTVLPQLAERSWVPA
jgi:hypothetical protein